MTHYIIVFVAGLALGALLFFLACWSGKREWARREEKTKASLTRLVSSAQRCTSIDELKSLLDSWIKANDLHPEKVKTYSSAEELEKALREGRSPRQDTQWGP